MGVVSVDVFPKELVPTIPVMKKKEMGPVTGPSNIHNNHNVVSHKGQHSELEKICILDTKTMSRIVPNSEPICISNECFEGEVFFMVRTPDVDNAKDNNIHSMGETPKRISEYLKPKKRHFEFQFQIKLKKVPTGPLFLGCEVEHPIKVGRVTKSLTSFLLAMIRRINSGFHYSWGVDPKDKDYDVGAVKEGNYERTHLSFPVEASMDRIIITKPGETPPPLGHELHESNESVKRRRKLGAGCIDWNLKDTYTMCLWSAYVDWIKWKSLNVPGCPSFSMSTVTGNQPIYLSVYELTNCSNDEYKKKKPEHYQKDVSIYTRLEFSNSTATEGGMVERFSKSKGLQRRESEPSDTDSDTF
jgi:hypothetical protein